MKVNDLISRAVEIDPDIIRENAWRMSKREVKSLAEEKDFFVAEDKEDAIEELSDVGLVINAGMERPGAGNLWKPECIQIIEDIAAKEGWNVIYERLRALNPMAV